MAKRRAVRSDDLYRPETTTLFWASTSHANFLPLVKVRKCFAKPDRFQHLYLWGATSAARAILRQCYIVAGCGRLTTESAVATAVDVASCGSPSHHASFRKDLLAVALFFRSYKTMTVLVISWCYEQRHKGKLNFSLGSIAYLHMMFRETLSRALNGLKE